MVVDRYVNGLIGWLVGPTSCLPLCSFLTPITFPDPTHRPPVATKKDVLMQGGFQRVQRQALRVVKGSQQWVEGTVTYALAWTKDRLYQEEEEEEEPKRCFRTISR